MNTADQIQTYKDIQQQLQWHGIPCSVVKVIGEGAEEIKRIEVFEIGINLNNAEKIIKDLLSEIKNIKITQIQNNELIYIQAL